LRLARLAADLHNSITQQTPSWAGYRWDVPDVWPPEPVRQAILLIPNLGKLLFGLLRDPRVPVRRKLLAAAAAGYAIMPVDLIPDVFPVLGQLDDLLLIVLALKHLLEGAPPDALEEHWDGPDDMLDVIEAVADWGAGLAPRPLRIGLQRLMRP
jgi:uncharacterized membrane protein YkvA (DUF1232 family)